MPLLSVIAIEEPKRVRASDDISSSIAMHKSAKQEQILRSLYWVVQRSKSIVFLEGELQIYLSRGGPALWTRFGLL